MVELEVINELALFAGAGGGILGGQLLGWRTVCAVEIDPYCRKVLLQRQADGVLPQFPIWDDVRTFDARPWRGKVDIVTGGFPCQDISCAGKGGGLAGERSGLVFEMLSIINEIRPCFVWAENSPQLRTRGLGSIIKALDSMGYDVRWCVLGAWHVGAPHRRNRMWLLAINTECEQLRDESRWISRSRWEGSGIAGNDGSQKYLADSDEFHDDNRRSGTGEICWFGSEKTSIRGGNDDTPNPNEIGRYGGPGEGEEQARWRQPADKGWWTAEPDVDRVAHGVAEKLDKP